MTVHAKLSASGASRWLACTPSVKLEGNYENTTSVYAEEGTFAHEYGELLLSLEYDYIKKRSFNTKLKKLKENDFYSKELEEYVQSYVNSVIEFVNELKATNQNVIVFLEQRVDFSDWVPDGFGTGDVVAIADNTLHIMDLKYGKGVPVFAEGNPQLRLYGLGAYSEFGFLYDIEKVKMTIIQPRLDNISTEELELTTLLTWADEVKVKAEMAYNGEGEYISGDHCRFCKAKNDCRKRASDNIELAKKYDFADTDILNEFEIADILCWAKNVTDWLKDIQDFALKQAENKGIKYPGFKLVEGRSNRKYVDETKVAEVLKENEFTEDVIYKPQALKGITDLEKTLGKKAFNELLSDMISKPEGKPTLVSITDKRSEINSIDKAKEDFANVEI
ncbi:DUF2800 domain-containing protein [Metaclostridioides mangenotii]|uniref:DUF2800 domain-containing protein n=1 Tax=Metaclostridioides mangenotii TaxID=1540 RepID=UPI0028E9C59D|nr:DUF2800 domain-containing protein [Clostridioides mangenotii]